ncbi:MAG: Gfo/Idh/MocA family oxidoreductase [Melioribacteraceae bacterium]|nr:Gfo/Idh/MocA family oxidoreductase [Melioribacteraceae bacterium]
MKNINWGIIGCGDVTEVKSGPAFNKVKDSKLVAVMRRDSLKAADYAKRHHVPKWYDDADKLINDPDVNAVYIATPPSTHAFYTIKVAEAGKPVYVEKPMASDYSECLKMIEACKVNNVPLFVAYYRRMLPLYIKVKELIDNGIIGNLRTLNIQLHLKPYRWDYNSADHNWRVNPTVAGGGYFYDLASHQLDFFDYVFGPVKNVSGIFKNQAGLYSAEDNVQAVFEFENGVLGNGSWCFTVSKYNQIDRVEINGDKGLISFSTFDLKPLVLITEKGKKEMNLDPPENIQLPLIETVVADLLGRGKCPSTGETGARTNKVLDKVLGKI